MTTSSLSQQSVETVRHGTPASSLSQQSIETVRHGTPASALSQQSIEILLGRIVESRLGQQSIELVVGAPTYAQLAQQSVELLLKPFPTIVGYDNPTDDMLVNTHHAALSRPLLHGSDSSLVLPINDFAAPPALRIPGYGFFTGRSETLTLECWLQFDQHADLPPRTPVSASAGTILMQFSEFANLRIYRNYLLFVWRSQWWTCPIQYFNYPMLLQLTYSKRQGIVTFSLILDGQVMIQDIIDDDRLDDKTQHIFFSNNTSYCNVRFGPIVMYPYWMNASLATKHYIYGEGVKIPQQLKSFTVNGIVEASASYSAKHLTRFDVPAMQDWAGFTSYNLDIQQSTVAYTRLDKPTYVQLADTPYYYFSNIRQYFAGSPLGIGIESRRGPVMPKTKYALFVVALGTDYFICYRYEDRIRVDVRLGDMHIEQVLDIAIPHPDYINVITSFQHVYTAVSYQLQQLFNSDKTTVHIGYMPDALQSHTEYDIGDGELVQPGWYEPLPDAQHIPFKTKFLNAVLDTASAALQTGFDNSACTYQHHGLDMGEIFQTGLLTRTFPLSVLTHQVDVPDTRTGNTTSHEQLDYIQLHIDTTEEITVGLHFFNPLLSTAVERVVDDQLVFDTWDDLLNTLVILRNNDIIKLPPLVDYSNTMVTIRLDVNANEQVNQTQVLDLNNLRLTGFAHKHQGATAYDTLNGCYVTPFSRTDNMVFPAFNSPVQLLMPSLDRSFYTLSELTSFYLVDDPIYDDPMWKHGFLIQQNLSKRKQDIVHGYTLFFKSDAAFSNRMMIRMNPIDGPTINNFGGVEIYQDGDVFTLWPNQFPASFTMYIDGEQYNYTPLKSNEWYNLTVLYHEPVRIEHTQSVYLEFVAPSVYYTNIGLLATSISSDMHSLIQLIGQSAFAEQVYNAFIGNTRKHVRSHDAAPLWPVIQSAWTSIYMNIAWNKQSLQYEDVV